MKKMIAAVLLASTIVSANAADLPSRKAPILAPPPPVFTWSGFYVGINAGGTIADRSTSTSVALPLFNLAAPNGFLNQLSVNAAGSGFLPMQRRPSALLGVQAGYNLQFASNFLVGFETDIQGILGSGDRGSYAFFAPASLTPVFVNGNGAITKRLDYLGTVRGRFGYTATPSFLVYATGGLAYGGVKSNTLIAEAFPFATDTTQSGAAGSLSTTRVGYTVGAGVEWMFMPNWSLKTEYLYYDLGRTSYNGGTNLTANGPNTVPNGVFLASSIVSRIRYSGHIARIGVNYHFWAPAASAVVARY